MYNTREGCSDILEQHAILFKDIVGGRFSWKIRCGKFVVVNYWWKIIGGKSLVKNPSWEVFGGKSLLKFYDGNILEKFLEENFWWETLGGKFLAECDVSASNLFVPFFMVLDSV